MPSNRSLRASLLLAFAIGLAALAPRAAAEVTGTDCGCTETGPYLLPDAGVRPAIGTIDATFSVITSPGGRYRLERVGSNPLDPWRVVRVSDGAVLHPGIVANNFTWSPDDHLLATNRQDASALQYFGLWDLRATGGAAEIWSLNGLVWASARHRFSDDGRSYLFAGVRNVNQVTLNVVDVPTGAVHATTFPVSTLPADIDTDLPENFDAPSNPGIAGWGWGPDPTRFVYSWRTGTSPAEVAQTLVNVRTGETGPRFFTYPSAKWGFSPCGDVFGIVYKEFFTQPGADALLYETFRPSQPALNAPAAAFAFDTVELGTNADDHFGLLGGVETPIAPNGAGEACSPTNAGPVAAFTPPAAPVAGQPAAFTDTSSDADGVVVSRSWNFGDGNTSTARNPSHTYAQAGEYTVRLTVRDDDGATATTTRTVRVCGSIGAVPGKLLFSVTGTQRLDLYAFDTQSLATSRITFQSGPSSNDSRWSPDGTKIAFAGSDFVAAGIYTMNADGTDRRALTAAGQGNFVDHRAPVWSPDGEWIAFLNDRERPGNIGPRGLYMVRKDGTGLARIPGTDDFDYPYDMLPSVDASCRGLAASARGPSCYRVVYVRDTRTSVSQPFQATIRSIGGGGEGPRILIGTPGVYYDVRVSPDGQKIAYARFTGFGPKGGTSRVFVANIAADPIVEPTTPVSTGGDDYHEFPVWSPDGSLIAFTSAVIPFAGSNITDRDIWLTDVGGCEAEPLIGQPGPQEWALDWRPGSATQALGIVNGVVSFRQLTIQDPILPAPGVTVELLGAGAPRTTTTDAQGRYEFTGIPIGANVTVRVLPSPDFVVETPEYVFTGLTGAAGNTLFFGLPDRATISGEIREDLGFGSSRPLAGVAVRVEGPGGPYQATTDAQGRYAVQTRYRQPYTVTPELAGFRFDPPSRSFETVFPTMQFTDFSAQPLAPPGFVAFTSSRDGNDEIYVSELDGTREANLTNDPASDVEPAVSPDGAKIAFASDRSGSHRIYLMTPDGSELTEVETADGSGVPLEGRDPAWSFDGARLAVATPSGLRIVSFDGSPPRDVTSNPEDADPAFDPSGERLFFARPLRDANGDLVQVVLLELDLTAEPPLESLRESAGFGAALGDPAVRPDGAGFAYTRGDIAQPFASIVVRDDTTFTTTQFPGRDPSWSPDGRHLVGVFTGSNLLFWTEPDGAIPRVFSTSEADREPSWGPGSLEPQCGNGRDDDGDGLTDLDDPSCSSPSDRSERGYGPCDDTTDDDGDGFAAFPQDPGCADVFDFDERDATLVCDNGLDDDGDGLTDFPADAACADPLATTETATCQNGFDDEGDGLADLDDPTCNGDPNGSSEAAACQNGIDDDEDGEIDLADGGCDDANDASERGFEVCDDEIDDDGDGFVGFPQDPGCASVFDTDETSFRFACDDGADNDGDGLIDMADPGCPRPDAGVENPQCDDGGDNDGDGFTDAADPTCQTSWPYWESMPACGFGAELALVVPALAAWRRRIARRARAA